MKKYLYLSIIFTLLIPSIASAVGKCEAEITNGYGTDPGVIFGHCWDPTDNDCLCSEKSDDGCLTKYSSKDHDAEEFDTTCTMRNFFDNLLEKSGHSKVAKKNGNHVQMLFFAPNRDYLNQSKRKGHWLHKPKKIKTESELDDELSKINHDLIKYNDQPMTHADLARDRFISGALQSWQMSQFHIPNNVTIKTEEENRILYIMGYPFFMNGYCIWHDCDDDAMGTSGLSYTDWIESIEDRFNEEQDEHEINPNKGTSRINYFGRMEKKEPFIAIGNKLKFSKEYKQKHFTTYNKGDYITLLNDVSDDNNIFHKARVPIDFTEIKKKIRLDGTLNLEGDGYIVFKNIHFILGEKGNFKINGKTTVIFSECIIEYQDNSNTKSTFVLNDIEEKKHKKIVFLDTIPENPAPLYLYYTTIKIPMRKDESNEKGSSTQIRDLSVELSGHVLFSDNEHIDLIGSNPGNMPNPWGLSSSGPVPNLDDDTFTKTIACIKHSVDSCKIDKGELGEARIYHQLKGKKLILQAYTDNLVTENSDHYILRYSNSKIHVAVDPKTGNFYKIEVRMPTIDELLGREANPWEIVKQDGSQYVLGCSYKHLKANTEGTSCKCIDDSLDFNNISGNCTPTKEHLNDDQILVDIKDEEEKIINREIQNCSELHTIPNEDKTACVECPIYQVEKTEDIPAEDSDGIVTKQLGICEPLVCPPDYLYEAHHCGDKCMVPNQMPDRSLSETPTECVPCELYQKEGEGDLVGTCIDLNCNEDEILVPHNHTCVKCKTNFIAKDMECVACPVGTNRLGDENICADAGEDDPDTNDCESDEDCSAAQACSVDGECENIICDEGQSVSNHSCVGESNPIECQEDIECNEGYVCVSNTCIQTCETNEDCDTQLVCGPDGFCKALVCESPFIAAEHECKDPADAIYVVNAQAGSSGGCSLVANNKSSDLLYSLIFLISTLLIIRFSKYSKI